MIIIIITTMRMITKNENDCKNDDYNNGFHNYDHDNHDKENNETRKTEKEREFRKALFTIPIR